MKRENQKFYGILKDKELYLIEDALMKYKEVFCSIGENERKEEIDKLINKLYSEFAEMPSNCKISMEIQD